MPVPKELLDQIPGAEQAGHSPSEILEGIRANPKYADVSAQIDTFMQGGHSPEEILSGLKAAPVAPSGPSMLQRLMSNADIGVDMNKVVDQAVRVHRQPAVFPSDAAPVPAAAPAVLPAPEPNGGTMLEKLQALKGAPVVPGMPVSVEQLASQGVTGAGSRIVTDLPGVARQFATGSAAALNQGMAGIADVLDKTAEDFSRATGLPKGGLFERAKEEYANNSQYWDKKFQESGPDAVAEFTTRFAGGMVPGVIGWELNVPFAAKQGWMDAEAKGENPVLGAVRGSIDRLVTGGVFKATAPLARPERAAVLGTAFGGKAAAEGGNVPEEIATGVGLAMAGGPGGVRVRDLLARMKEKGRTIEAPKPEPSTAAAGTGPGQPAAAASSEAYAGPERRADAARRSKVEQVMAAGDANAVHDLIYKDQLTGLENQRAWNEAMDSGSLDGLHIMTTDVQGLKFVNDKFGHDIGDQLIAAVGEAYRTAAQRAETEGMGRPDILARSGTGDEVSMAVRDSKLASRIYSHAFDELNQRVTLTYTAPDGKIYSLKNFWLDVGFSEPKGTAAETRKAAENDLNEVYRPGLVEQGLRNPERGGRPPQLVSEELTSGREVPGARGREAGLPAEEVVPPRQPEAAPAAPAPESPPATERPYSLSMLFNIDGRATLTSDQQAWLRGLSSAIGQSEARTYVSEKQTGEGEYRAGSGFGWIREQPEFKYVPVESFDKSRDTAIIEKVLRGESLNGKGANSEQSRLKELLSGWYDLQQEQSGRRYETLPGTEAKEPAYARPASAGRDFALSAPEIIQRMKQPKAEQQGMDLGTTGRDLRAPERENKPVTMDELPLGRATNEAADRAKQTAFEMIQEKKKGELPASGSPTELHSFPSPIRSLWNWALDIKGGQSKRIERVFDRIGEWISPAAKTEVAKFARSAHFLVEEHPAAEPLFERNLDRQETNHRESRSIFARDMNDPSYGGVQPILDMTKPEREAWDRIMVRGDVEKARYSVEQLRKRFGASDRVVSAYEAARSMIERLQGLEIEKSKELALTPYETDPALYDKLSRVMNDLVDIRDAKDREKYMSRLFHEQAAVLDAQTQSALTRLQGHVDAIHDRIGVFEDNPGYIPRERDERAFHVRVYERVLSQEDASKVLGAIMYGRKARQFGKYSPEELQKRFGIAGKVADAYNEAMDRVEESPILSHTGVRAEEAQKEIGRIVDRIAAVERYMDGANTYATAKNLRAKIQANPEKYFPENYRPGAKYEFSQPIENKKLAEEVYQDIGNPAAREAILERAVKQAEAKGSISMQDAEAISDALLIAMKEEQLKRAGGKTRLKRADQLIEGYKTRDLDKVIVGHVTGQVGYLNKGLYSIRALRDMEGIKDQGEKRWASVYYKNSLKNNTKLDNAIGQAKSVAVFMRLGAVVKTMVQNSFQQAMTAWPELARFAKNPGVLLLRAEKDVLSRNLTAFDKKVLQEGIESGAADAQYMRDISGATQRGPERGFSQLVELSMKGFGAVEMEMNRKPALLAAMRLFTGQKDGRGNYYGLDLEGKPYSMDWDTAMREAKKFVRSTHYEITKANEPEIVQTLGGVVKGAYTFQSYTANYLNWLFNRARHGEIRVLGRAMLIPWALGGLAAAPFSDEIDAWLTKNFGFAVKKRLRDAIRAALRESGADGEQQRTLEDIAMNGLPAGLLGVDMSKSVQINTPLPVQIFLDTDRDVEEKATGAIGGLFISGARAIRSAAKGDYDRAVEQGAPNAVGNIMRAYRLYNEGATSTRGKMLTDERGRQIRATGKEAIEKGLGFQPARLSKYDEMNRTEWNLKKHWGDRRQDLLDAYRLSGQDREKRAKVLRDIQAFNNKLKDSDAMGIVPFITPQAMIGAIMQKPNLQEMVWKQRYAK